MELNELKLQGFYSNGDLFIKVPRTFEEDVYAFFEAVMFITPPPVISVELLDDDEIQLSN